MPPGPWQRLPSALPAVAIFGLLAAAVSVAAPGRFGVTVDSGEYLGVAKSLLHGHGLSLAYSTVDEAYRPPTVTGQTVPLTQFPPLFPLLIAAIAGVTRVSTYAAAIVLNTFAFAWAGARLGAVVRRRGLGALALFLSALLAAPVVEPAVMVWAEPVKLAFLTEACLALAAAVHAPTTHRLLRFALFGLLATSTHFTGVAVGVAAVLVVWARSHGSRAVAVVGVTATALPLVAWTVYAREIGGGLGQKSIGFHPPVSVAAAAALLALIALLAALFVTKPDDVVAHSLLAVAAGSLFTLLASRTFVDRNISLDRRQLQAAVVLTVAALLIGWPVRQWAGRLTGAVVVAAVVLGPVLTAVRIRSVMHSEWAGYQADRWQSSPLLRSTTGTGRGAWILTNAPDAVALLTAAHPIGLPLPVNLYTGEANADYLRQVAELRCLVSERQPRLAFFFRPTRGHFRQPDPRLLAALHAHEETRFSDGILYAVETSGC